MQTDQAAFCCSLRFVADSFACRLGAAGVKKQRSTSSNIVPLNRKMSDTLRLRLSAAELSRAQSRPASGLSGIFSLLLTDVALPVDVLTAAHWSWQLASVGACM